MMSKESEHFVGHVINLPNAVTGAALVKSKEGGFCGLICRASPPLGAAPSDWKLGMSLDEVQPEHHI